MPPDNQQQPNNVWDTIAGGASGVVSKILDYKLESQRIRTQAAPSGASSNTGPNPFPGTQSDHPQNDTKAGFNAGDSFALPNWALALIVGAVILFVIGMVRR
jgi:hypothetical protein